MASESARYESMFYDVSRVVLESQFIKLASYKFVISLLKQIFSEVHGSKSELMFVSSVSDTCAFRLWFLKQMQPTSD